MQTLKKNFFNFLKASFFLILILGFSSNSAIAGGAAHLVAGNVTNSDASTPGTSDIDFSAYITIRTGEVQTQDSPGCLYDGTAGAYQIEVGNFTTPWTIGETLRVEFTNTANNEIATIDVILTGAGTDVQSVTLAPPPPVADFSADSTTITRNGTVNFTDLSTNSPTTWSWTFGDGGTSTSQNPSHQYTVAGTYTVTLTATNASGSDGETKTNYITVNPIQYNLTMAVSPGSSGTTTPTIGTAATNEGSVSISAVAASGYGFVNWTSSPAATFGNANLASTTVTLSENLTVTANFGLLPVAEFSADSTTITRNETVTFTDASTNSPTSWSWNFGDGGTSTSQNPTHQYTTAGTYTVTLTATNSVGTGTPEVKTGYITVNPIQYNLTMAVSPAGTGTTTPAIGTAVTNEGSVSISATPASGYQFDSWTSTPSGATFGNANSASTTVNLTQNMTVTANFTLIPPDTDITVTSVSPTLISNDVANTIHIYGTSFDSGDSITAYITNSATDVEIELATTFVSSTSVTAIVPSVSTNANVVKGNYEVTLEINGIDYPDGSVITLKITAPVVISDDDLEDLADAGDADLTNVDEDTDVTAADLTALVNSGVISSASAAALQALITEGIQIKIETVGSTKQITATSTEPIKLGSTGTAPIQFTLTSAPASGTPVDAQRTASISATIPKGTTITTSSGAAYTGSIMPPAQIPITADMIAAGLDSNAVAFTMGALDQTLEFGAGQTIYVEIDVTIPTPSEDPVVYYVDANGDFSEAGIDGTSPDGTDIETGGTILATGTNANDATSTDYTFGLILDHMSTFVVGSFSAGLSSSSSVFICFISSVAAGVQAMPSLLTVLMLIGSALGIFAWRRKKD